MNKIIIANWKMNGSIDMLLDYINHMIDIPAIIGLPDIYLGLAKHLLDNIKQNHSIKIASQNISIYPHYGAYTAQISADMLKDTGVKYVIIGHSEIRTYFHTMLDKIQTNEIDYTNFITDYLSKQLQNAIDAGIIPIFCIGESIEKRISGAYGNFLLQQLSIIKNLNGLSDIIIAYEPIWAIGSGLTPTIAQIEEISIMIKEFLLKQHSNINHKIVYGGSVNSNNINEIVTAQNIDGVLVGGASLKWETFKELVKLSYNCL
jgi:triosephosphate isomerase